MTFIKGMRQAFNKTFLGMMVIGTTMMTSCTVHKTTREKEIIPVKTVTVAYGQTTDTRNYVGTAQETRAARVSCRYPGKLVALNVKEGDHVQEGTVLAVISSQSVLTTKDIADATLKQAMDGYERMKKLHDGGSLPDVKMIEIETQLAKAKAASMAADKALEECSVKAPFSGVVSEVFVEEGVELDLLRDIVKIMDISSLEIGFSVPENELAQIHVGDAATVSVPALGIDRAEASILDKGISASPLSHTYRCTLKTRKNLAGMMPGMVCKVYLGNTQGEGAVIPAAAIRTDDRGRYVWTVENDIVGKKYIQPDGFSEKGVIIREGLENGEKVIVEGVQKVCTGMKVRIK